MARNDIEMRITADSKGVATGLAPMMRSLDSAQKSAADTEAALAGIGAKPVTLSVNDAAIENARKEISRLRTQIRETLSTDVTADTSDAQKRIKELQRILRVLDAEHPVVEVDIEADTSQLAQLRASFESFSASGAGLGGIARGLGAIGTGGAAAAGGAAAVAAGIAIIGAKSGAAAGDIESLRLQLDALTEGEGAEALEFLQAWAKQTPFELTDAIDATKRLVAAGVDLQQIPDYLNDIGNASSALDVPLEEVATVFGQMESKGKATFEEIQQLAERGIPAWQLLADSMGVSVAELQKLATEGKLTADAIDLLREAMGERFEGAMADQADTLNGKLSSLRDTLTQTWQAFGTLSVEGLKGGVDMLQDLSDMLQDFARIYVWAYDKVKDAPFIGTIATGFENLGKAVGWAKDGLDDLADSVTGADDDAVTLGDDVVESLVGADSAIQQTAQSVEELENALRDAADAAVDAFAAIGDGIRARVDFIISKDDLREEINQAIAGTEDEKGITLPAKVQIKDIAGLDDQQQDLVGLLSDFAVQGLEEGVRRADLANAMGQSFDAAGFYRSLRDQLKPLVLEAGIDPKNLNAFITNVLGVPKPLAVQPELTGVEDTNEDIDRFLHPRQFFISPTLTGKPKGVQEALNTLIYGSTVESTTPAVIEPTVEGAAAASTAVDNVASPGGQDRKARIDVLIDPVSLSSANYILDQLLATETKIIKIHMEENPTGEDLSSPGAVDRMLNTATTGGGGGGAYPTGGGTSGGGRGGTSAGGTVVTRAPKQTPIQVILDGAVIADHLELKAGRLAAAGSVRRRA